MLFLEFNIACHVPNADCTYLCHKRLGRLNYTALVKLTKLKAIRGVPTLTERHEGVCGSCQKRQAD